MEAINKFVVEPSDVWPGVKYIASVHTSVDGGQTFWYAGNSRFCRNLNEAFMFYLSWTDPWYEVIDYRDRRWPNAEIVTEMPDGFYRDFCTHDKPFYGEWIENYRTGERKILYTGKVA